MTRKTIEAQSKALKRLLWATADARRGNRRPSGYKHIVLCSASLKCISDRFEDGEAALAALDSGDYIPNEARRRQHHHEQLELCASEAAFYDTTVQNDAASRRMGDDALKKMVDEFVESIRKNAMPGWDLKEALRAATRSRVRYLLAKYCNPPYLKWTAVDSILEQTEIPAGECVG